MAQRLDTEVRGPFRRSVNQAQGVPGSIHTDSVAAELGFRGGTVAGSIHLELFPPVLIEVFGQRWFERGTLSMNFRNATTNEEPVCAIVDRPQTPGDAQVAARIERDDGLLVGEGTASVGDVGEPTALGALDLDRFSDGDYEILAEVVKGDEIPAVEVPFTGQRQLDRLGVITEPLDWYSQPSPWGGPVATPATIVDLLYAHPAAVIAKRAQSAVGLFGAIEVRHINGPVLLDSTYSVCGEIVAKGQSPKTEYVWFESWADADGVRVAEMLMQLRWMKSSGHLA